MNRSGRPCRAIRIAACAMPAIEANAVRGEMVLLDELMPVYDVVERHRIVVHARRKSSSPPSVTRIWAEAR